MILFRWSVLIFSVVVLGSGVSVSEAGKQKKKAGRVTGTVINVAAGTGDVLGTITVQPKSKKNSGAEAKELKISLGKDTKIQKAIGKKQDQQTVDAAFTDIEAGMRVSVTLRAGSSDQADRVVIREKKKKAN